MNIHRSTGPACTQPRRHLIGHGLLVACGLAGWATGQAQEAPQAAAPAASAAANVIDKVTVTARKRDELLLDVPISVQAYSEKALRATGAYDLQDLKVSSGFTLNQTGGTSAGGRALGNLTFRGLQGDTAFLPNENSGGLFVDGIYISTGVGSVNTVDVSRVEVLKGPQNAFFGRATFGGAINFITKNPSNVFRSEVNSSFSARGSSDIDATLEGPLMADLLSARVTLVNHNKAASYRASDGGDLGAEKTTSITGTLYATPTPQLWLRLRGHYQQDDDSSPAIGYLPARGNTSCTGLSFPGYTADGTYKPFTPATNYFCGSIPSFSTVGGGVVNANTSIPAGVVNAFEHNSLNDPFMSKAPSLDHSGLRRNTKRASTQAGYELPYGAELAFNLGYNKSSSLSIWDLDRTVSPNYLNALPIIVEDLTADVRVSSDPKKALRGLVGLSYFKQSYQFAQLDYDNYATPVRDPNNFINNKSEVPALYGSVDYDILSNLTASADARQQTDKITSYPFSGAATYSNTQKNFLPRVALRFKPDNNTSVYGSYAKGVQQLATNSGYINATPTVRAYIASVVPGSSEYTPQPKLDSFEIGIKQSVMGNRIEYALAAYDQKWHNRLTQTTILCPPGQALTAACPLSSSGTSVAFGNEARIKGIELSINAVVTPQFTLGAYFDYKRARWASYYNAALGAVTGTAAPRTVRFDGNTLSRVPDLMASVNATYRTALSSGWTGYVRGDVNYTGRAWDTDLNIVQTDPYTRVNLRTGIEKGDATLELFAKNLFNDKHWDNVFRVAELGGAFPGTFAQGFTVTPPPRREFGIRARYVF